jgi:predicted nucleic acid-binding protein
MSDVIYLDASAVLRAILEHGLSPAIEQRIGGARFLITSRLSMVESARALLRLRVAGAAERDIADATREADAIWSRCTLWELTPAVCDLAAQLAPLVNLRTLDALHAATYLIARRRLGADVDLLTADRLLDEAIRGIRST